MNPVFTAPTHSTSRIAATCSSTAAPVDRASRFGDIFARNTSGANTAGDRPKTGCPMSG